MTVADTGEQEDSLEAGLLSQELVKETWRPQERAANSTPTNISKGFKDGVPELYEYSKSH